MISLIDTGVPGSLLSGMKTQALTTKVDEAFSLVKVEIANLELSTSCTKVVPNQSTRLNWTNNEKKSGPPDPTKAIRPHKNPKELGAPLPM